MHLFDFADLWAISPQMKFALEKPKFETTMSRDLPFSTDIFLIQKFVWNNPRVSSLRSNNLVDVSKLF